MDDLDTTYAIIGGGIAGSSIAYHLSRRTDESITVFERQSIGSETTFKSMAMYGLYGNETKYRMKQYGLELYNQFFAAPEALPRYEFSGRIYAATTAHGAAELESALTDKTGTVSGVGRDLLEYISGADLKSRLLIPRVNTEEITGAVYRPRVGYMQPHELAHEFAERARANGVTFQTGVQVTDINTDDGSVSGLEIAEGTVHANEIICAAGPWNVSLAQQAGVELPVRHTHAPILKFQPDERAVYSLPAVSHYETAYSIYRQRARDQGAMYVGYNPSEPTDDVEEFLDTYEVFDPASTDETIPSEIRDGMFETVERFYPSLLDADIVDEWVGIRSGTPDGNPIVGWTSVDGFSIAAFHTSGIQLSPKVGDIISRQLIDGDPTSFYDALSINRFEGYTDIHDGSPPMR